jgi:aminoglycoside 6'-N-acetyltransferase I
MKVAKGYKALAVSNPIFLKIYAMPIESLSETNARDFTSLCLELWPDCSFEEEYEAAQQMLQSDRETAFLYQTSDGEYVGFIALSLRTDYVEGTDSSPVGYVEGLYVKESYQRMGIGQRLLAAGEAWCRQRGCIEMASDTELSNQQSQAFHLKAGFTEANRIVCYRKTL